MSFDTRPKDLIIVVSDDLTTANMDPWACIFLKKISLLQVLHKPQVWIYSFQLHRKRPYPSCNSSLCFSAQTVSSSILTEHVSI